MQVCAIGDQKNNKEWSGGERLSSINTNRKKQQQQQQANKQTITSHQKQNSEHYAQLPGFNRTARGRCNNAAANDEHARHSQRRLPLPMRLRLSIVEKRQRPLFLNFLLFSHQQEHNFS